MSISIKKFQVEFMDSPIGVKTLAPRFSWQIESDEKNVKQEGYSLKVMAWIADTYWETGYIESEKTLNIKYRGKSLERDTLYTVYLTVRVNGKDYTATTEFRTGMLGYFPPHIAWICADKKGAECHNAPYFRREFSLKSNEVAYATAYIAACGWYELYLNGKKIGEDEALSNSICRLTDVAALNAHDITKELKNGNNALGINLGCGFSATHFRPELGYEGPKRFWGYISIVFTDGSYQHIWTDESWKWQDSPITMNHLYDGEWYDARLELPGWNKPGFDDSLWKNAIRPKYFEGLQESFTSRIKILDTRPTHKINKIGKNTYIYDFKFNGSGVIKIKVKGDPGAEIIMHHAENIHDDGTLQPWTNRNAEATDRYILKGDGEEIYSPHFTYHCFRYAQITIKGNAEILEAEALVYGSDVFNESKFSCSNALINRIQENFIRTLKTNFMSWPADTGVRDERTACNMDSLVYEEMSMHNCNIHAYYDNWSYRDYGTSTPPNWDGEQIVLPWLMLKYYGNTELAKRYYHHLINLTWNFYYMFIDKNSNIGFFQCGYGDWTAPSRTNDFWDCFSHPREINTCLWYALLILLKDLAVVAGEECDIPQIEKFMEMAKTYVNDTFYDKETHLYSGGKQGPNLMALACGVAPEEDKEKILAALVKAIREKDNSHLDTGIFGTRLLIDVLSRSPEGLELVYDILTQTTYPSFGRQIMGKDATTAWEQWYNQQGMMTCSHSMYTGIGADFYKKFAGIINLEDCYKKTLIKPIAPSKITNVDCVLETVRGIFKVNWVRDDNAVMKLKVSIPANCEAIIEMPDGKRYEVGSGDYEF